MSEYSTLAAVERTFQIIEMLVGEVNGISVTELVNRTGLTKSIVSRILTTLYESGYVDRDSKTRYYKLSFHFMSMTYRHINSLGLEEIFYPMMEKIGERTGELIQLTVVKDDGIFYIAKIEGTNPLKIASMLGRRAPYHATAAGKVWLASLPKHEVYNLIGKYGLKQYTEKTITDMEVLMTELEEIKHKGYAIANQEINHEVTALAMPIYDHREKERVIAMLIIAAPRFKMTPERIEELRVICKEEISKFDTSLLSSFSMGLKREK
jgi:DNA-binding IclR family transcriptional regulator